LHWSITEKYCGKLTKNPNFFASNPAAHNMDEEDPATYEQLAELEREFDDVDTQISTSLFLLTSLSSVLI